MRYNRRPCAADEIFVFGSNLAGRHGAGAAKWARAVKGAQYGTGVGRTGDAYAIPTKDENLNVLPLDIVAHYMTLFIEYALAHPELKFYLTPIGCGLAGYSPEQIAPLFDLPLPRNVDVPPEFMRALSPELSTEPENSGLLDLLARTGDL